MPRLLMIGSTELILIVVLLLLLFGGKKIPELMHGLGKGMRSFKDGMNDVPNPEEPAKPEQTGEEEKEQK